MISQLLSVRMYPHIEAHCEYLRAAGYAVKTTITDRAEVLVRVTQEAGDLHTLTGDRIATWLGRERWSAQTRANYYGHIHGWYRWAVDTDRIPVNPMQKMHRPKVNKGRPRPTRRENLERILAEAAEPWRTAALLAAYAGLRAFEIGGLRREDVTQDDLVVRLGKGGYTDTLPTHPSIWEAVRDHPAGFIVLTRADRPYSPKALSTGFARHMRVRLGIDDTLHTLRHLYATTLLRLPGTNIRVVQELMRHRSLAATEIYTKVDGEERRAAIQALPPAA